MSRASLLRNDDWIKMVGCDFTRTVAISCQDHAVVRCVVKFDVALENLAGST